MKRNILSLAVLLICGTLFAQEENKNAVVSVENDYNPTVVTVNKRIFTPTVESKSTAKPAELIFSKQATPYNGFTSERDAKDVLPKQDRALPGYLRAGYGLRNHIDAKLAYSLNFGNKSYLRVLGTFDGFKCDINDETDKWNSRMFNTAAALDFGYKFKKLVVGINGDFNNRVLNYRRADYIDGYSNRQRHTNYNVDINGASQLAGPFAYTFKAGYANSLMNYADGLENPSTEQHINAGGTFAYEIYTKYMRRAGIEVDFNGFLYNGMLHNSTNAYKNFLSMDFNPFADFNFNNWEITFGAMLNFRTGNGPVLAAAPHITVDKALTKRISFYSTITGGRKDNSFKTIEGITPYWGYNTLYNKQIKPTYRIIDAVVGTRMTLEPLYFDVYAGYVLTKDDLLQIPVLDVPTGLIYSNFEQEFTNNVHAGGRIGYDYGGWINFEADARYDYWSCKNKNLLALRPEITANAKIEVRPIKNLTIKVGYNFTRYTKNESGMRITDKHDLHARASYTINRYFGAFIQGDNLINDKYYEYAGYLTRGIRGMLGVTVNF
jgi:hypothetical protein